MILPYLLFKVELAFTHLQERLDGRLLIDAGQIDVFGYPKHI
jgi:hypothetical protein